jgi:DNA-binding MarR family transcriptional regulator
MHDMGCSRSQLYRYMKELVEANWIERRPKDPANLKSVTLYTLHDKDLEAHQQKLADPERLLVSPVTHTNVSPVAHEVDEPLREQEMDGSCEFIEDPPNVVHLPDRTNLA